MGIFKKSAASSVQNAIGPELLAVLPKNAKPWYLTKHLILLNFLLCVPLFSSAAVGYDGSMMNGLQTLPQWRNFFNNPEAALLGTINAVYPIGKILGIYPATWLADRYGRKTPLTIGLIFLLIGPAIQGASVNLPMFIVSRMLIGAATIFIVVPSPILVTELAYPLHRGRATALYNTFFYFGAIFAAWFTYATFKIESTWAWRIPSILQAAIPSVQLAISLFLPESPRWLVAHGKSDQARKILVKYHAGGDENSPLVNHEMKEIEGAIKLESEVTSQASWVDLVRTAPNRRRAVITLITGFFAQWNGISVISYYLTLVLNTIGITSVEQQTLINGILQLFNFFIAVFGGALMVDRFGRRTLWLLGSGGMLLSYIAWTVISSVFVSTQDPGIGRGSLAFIFITYAFYDVSWTPLPLAYTVEIFPYTLRGRGVGLNLTATYFGLVLSQFLNPIALKALGWKYYIVFCCILFCLTIAIWFLFPETKGRSLEEIAEVFDGKKEASADREHEDKFLQQVEQKDATSSVKSA